MREGAVSLAWVVTLASGMLGAFTGAGSVGGLYGVIAFLLAFAVAFALLGSRGTLLVIAVIGNLLVIYFIARLNWG